MNPPVAQRRVRRLFLGVAGVVLVDAAFLAGIQLPVRASFSTVQERAERGGPSVFRFASVAHPDRGLIRRPKSEGGGVFALLEPPGDDPAEQEHLLVGYFPPESEFAALVSTATHPLTLDLIGRATPDLEDQVRRGLGPALTSQTAVRVVTIGTRGRLLSPLEPVFVIGLALFLFLKGDRVLRGLKDRTSPEGELHQFLLFAAIALTFSTTMVVDQAAQRLGLGRTALIFPLGLIAFIGLMFGTRRIEKWLALPPRN